MSYFDDSNDDLKVIRCNDFACTGANETTTTVDSSGDVGSFGSITIGVDRYPVIAYSDITNNALKVAHCSNISCTPLFRQR